MNIRYIDMFHPGGHSPMLDSERAWRHNPLHRSIPAKHRTVVSPTYGFQATSKVSRPGLAVINVSAMRANQSTTRSIKGIPNKEGQFIGRVRYSGYAAHTEPGFRYQVAAVQNNGLEAGAVRGDDGELFVR
jgi:hypothetical protein